MRYFKAYFMDRVYAAMALEAIEHLLLRNIFLECLALVYGLTSSEEVKVVLTKDNKPKELQTDRFSTILAEIFDLHHIREKHGKFCESSFVVNSLMKLTYARLTQRLLCTEMG